MRGIFRYLFSAFSDLPAAPAFNFKKTQEQIGTLIRYPINVKLSASHGLYTNSPA